MLYFNFSAYGDKSLAIGKPKSSSTATIAAVIGVVAFIAVAAVAAFIIIRKRNQQNAGAKMTMTERMALRGQSKDDLLRSDIMMSNVVSLFI